jgi:hypothetical protein
MTSHPAFMNNRINKSIDQRSAAQRSAAQRSAAQRSAAKTWPILNLSVAQD